MGEHGWTTDGVTAVCSNERWKVHERQRWVEGLHGHARWFVRKEMLWLALDLVSQPSYGSVLVSLAIFLLL